MFITASRPIPKSNGSEVAVVDILRPRDEAALIEAVADAAAEKHPVALEGRGTKAGLGRPFVAEFRISLEQVSGITYYEAGELVMEAWAGTPLAEIEAALAARNQRLAFEPPDLGPLYGEKPGAATIGGVFACNLSGPRRPFAGAARDHLLGVRAVSGRGELFVAGGRVVKNVTGYDMGKLLAGSFGTLAALARVTFKVLPKPEAARTVLLGAEDRDEGLQVMAAAWDGPWDSSGAIHLCAEAAARSSVSYVAAAETSVTAFRLEGARGAVAERARKLRDALAPYGETEELHTHNTSVFWREIGDGMLLPPEDNGMLWRLSLPPASTARIADRVAAMFDAAPQIFDWAGGLAWLVLPPVATVEDAATIATRLHLTVAECGGNATLWRAPQVVRETVPVFSPQPDALASVTRRIKNNFDPERILNPGRMWKEI